MKGVFGFVVASAALASAQYTQDNNGTITCDHPNVAYCAGDSLVTDIIIRCDSRRAGQPGRCSDNLAGAPPFGDQPADCWQTSKTSGDAACQKNCVVYGASGNANGTFTLPADECTPYATMPMRTITAGVMSSTCLSSASMATTSSSGRANGTMTTAATATAAPIQTAAAGAKQAMGACAGLGIFAAYLL